MKNLDVKGPQVSHVDEDSDPIDIALNKYVDHLSTFEIKEYFNEPTECNFSKVIPNDIKKETKILDSSEEGTYVARYYAIHGPKKLYEKRLFFTKGS